MWYIAARRGSNGRVVARESRLVITGAAQFDLRMRAVFVTFDEHKIDVAQMPQQLIERGFVSVAKFTDMRPATTGCYDHFFCTRLAVLMTVFTGMINIEIVVRVFDGCHTDTTTPQLFDELDN